MNTNEIIDEIEKLENEKDSLVKGYICNKTINGKTRKYLQFQENGKKISKYIPDNKLDLIIKEISRRKEIEEKLAHYKHMLPNDFINEYNHYSYKNNVIKGKQLINFISNARGFKKRFCYKTLQDYLTNSVYGKVFILYGLRRTGKITLIKQAILEMNEVDFHKTAFIQINKNSTLLDLENDLRYLEYCDYKYIFIDEITLLKDFIDCGSVIADIYASSMKIVLSGTDSLGFMISKSTSLFDRCLLCHTTFISYKEFEEVLGIKGIDEYIQYGGIMSLSGINYNKDSLFANAYNVNEYMDSSIANNIQHSLKYYDNKSHFRGLYDLFINNELTNVINRVIEDMNHKFSIDVITKEFESNDLGISSNNLRKDENYTLLNIDKKSFINRLKNRMSIINTDSSKVKIEENHIYEIKEYLDLLDLTLDIDINNISSTKSYRTLFIQPGMRYCQAKIFVEELLKDKIFDDISLVDKYDILARIMHEIKGRMLEDIVLLETKLSLKEQDVFKLLFSIGEYDMVVCDFNSLACSIYEIKYSDKILEEQYKHLLDKSKNDQVEFKYGHIEHRGVIYRGESKVLDNGIEYINVEEYLKELS